MSKFIIECPNCGKYAEGRARLCGCKKRLPPAIHSMCKRISSQKTCKAD